VARQPTVTRARALAASGWLNNFLADPGRAASLLAECRALAERLGEDAVAARAMVYSAVAAFQQGDTGGFALLEDALGTLRAVGDTFGVWLVLLHLALGGCAFDRPRPSSTGGRHWP
jgi:hypothetical protein